MRSKVPVACEASVGVLGLLGKAWKNTREVGDVFFNGKKYSKDAIKKVADEVNTPTLEEKQFVRKMVGEDVYTGYKDMVSQYNQLSPEFRAAHPDKIAKIEEHLAVVQNNILKAEKTVSGQLYEQKINALSPQKRELFTAYTHSLKPQYKTQWERADDPNIRIAGLQGLNTRYSGNPGQITEDLLSVSAITAGAVVGYSTLSHFVGGEE